jgi:transcriptional regulator with XRE-family HTH domain
LTQRQAAERLGISQPYLSLLERGERPLPKRLAKKTVSILRLPVTELPLPEVATVSRGDLGRQLAALGYPGFAYLRGGWRRNPAEVLLAALADKNVEPRVVEALPWLLLNYSDLNREWLTKQARLLNLSNRLGFIVTLAKNICESKGGASSNNYRQLAALENELGKSRLANEELFGRTSVSKIEEDWLRANRPPEAAYWHLLTDWRPEHLQYGGHQTSPPGRFES